jgi:hypothetical protein
MITPEYRGTEILSCSLRFSESTGVVYSPEMVEFLRELWADVSPDLRAQYADAIRGGNLIALMAIPHLVVRGLTLIGIDPDVLVVISFLDRWATVIVFASFLVGIVFRALAGILGSKKKV